MPLAAQAHTDAWLQEWITAWVVEADTSLTPESIAEWHDMVERHVAFFNPEPAHRHPSAPNRGMGPGVEAWRPLVAKYFNAADVNHALCIMDGESGGNPNALNTRGSSAAGLFQFLRSTWDNMVPRSVTGGSYDSGQVYKPEPNTRAAAWLAYNVSWDQWSVNRNC